MKKIIINIEEMSDSKEMYGQRPNPFIAAFIYCLVALLIAGLVYSFFGHIDIVSTASGIVRPNEDISTVSCQVGGKVTSVNYYDGLIVHEGDELLTVDMSDIQIQLNSLRESSDQYARQIKLLNMYLTGLQTETNPFSSDMQSDEYLYYIQFSTYLVNLQKIKEAIKYDIENDKETPPSLSLLTLEQTTNIVGELETAKNRQKDVDIQIDRAEQELSRGTVKAERSGVISQLATVVRGDNISSGTVLATIIPINESELKAQIYISSAYVGQVKVGDTIRYNITALPSNQYGTVNGKVLSISQDAIVQDGQYSGYFMIEGSIDNTTLIDRDNNVGRVVVGMPVEAKIVTESKSIMTYLLEKINIL